ncbi:MAG: 23S rRNA (pseudouridine(1915)-N(3))-methyltransferase RlmH [Eggerthellaceae bacterium]
MLRITVFAIGKLKESFWKDAVAEYLKRLSGYAKIDVRELPDSNMDQEAQALLCALPQSEPIILMDIKGKETSSEGLAHMIETYALEGSSSINFIIGGSDGVATEIKNRATRRISFGPITLPHNLARVVLLEQIYRAFKIIRKEPYHK